MGCICRAYLAPRRVELPGTGKTEEEEGRDSARVAAYLVLTVLAGIVGIVAWWWRQ